MGPVWKIFCLISMKVDIPADVVDGILHEQEEWDKRHQKRSTNEHRHKRYTLLPQLHKILVYFYQQQCAEAQEKGPL